MHLIIGDVSVWAQCGGTRGKPTLPIGLQRVPALYFAWLVVACGLAGNGVQGTV